MQTRRILGRTALLLLLAPACGPSDDSEGATSRVQLGASAVASLTLINADTNQPIAGHDPIPGGATLDLATLPTQNLNIRANTVPTTVGSVRFGLDSTSSYRTENSAPYALAGDTNGDYYAWTPSVGSHSVTATPFAGANASGEQGSASTVSFSVVNGDGGTGGSGGFSGRIAISSDGNEHDTDDWGATALSLAILAQAGLQSKLVHYDYSDHIWGSSSGWPAQMVESAVGGAQRFGFNTAVFFDDLTQLQAAINNMANVINASSATNRLTFILAGPMESAYRGFLAAQPSKRQYVRCISHSVWNDEHAVEHGGHHYDDIIALGCVDDHIQDQNPLLGTQSMANWAWLNNGGANLAWVYGRIDAVFQDGDASDAGMAWYAITGDTAGSPSKLRDFFGLSGGGSISVTSFTLINANTDQPVPGFNPVPNGATIDVSNIGTANLNLRANTSPAVIGSVRFAVDGNASYSTESVAPYALAGDTNGNYTPWTLALGSHSVTATPYSQSQAGGTSGTSKSVSFTIVP